MGSLLNFSYFCFTEKSQFLLLFFQTEEDVAKNWGHLTRFFDLVTLISNANINLSFVKTLYIEKELILTLHHEQIASFRKEKKNSPRKLDVSGLFPLRSMD